MGLQRVFDQAGTSTSGSKGRKVGAFMELSAWNWVLSRELLGSGYDTKFQVSTSNGLDVRASGAPAVARIFFLAAGRGIRTRAAAARCGRATTELLGH